MLTFACICEILNMKFRKLLLFVKHNYSVSSP